MKCDVTKSVLQSKMADNSAKLKAEIAYLTSMLRYFTFLIIFLVYFVIFNEADIISDIIFQNNGPCGCHFGSRHPKGSDFLKRSEFVLKDFSV